MTVKELLKQIEAGSRYTFAYADSQIPINKRVTIKAENKSIESILAEVMPEVTTKVQGNKILIAMPANGKATKTGTKNTVTGAVIDENGEPVIGATVMQKGTGNGVSTNIDGQFSIEVTGNKPTLTISFVGYKPVDVKATPGS
ncbi:MAG: carboxypeptidase-like regulatory domain-containing protein, partial [Muribaculaceae bacterium]|nr:carboxypeptidase-like regulatory domain-containing protein [Muribaculaceae bacterium]